MPVIIEIFKNLIFRAEGAPARHKDYRKNRNCFHHQEEGKRRLWRR
jgi:hypothetical protein